VVVMRNAQSDSDSVFGKTIEAISRHDSRLVAADFFGNW
jgi:hypothetical protein